jgi:hypothetical protein
MVKNLKDFLIYPLTLDGLTKIKNSSVLMARTKEEERIKKIVDKTLNISHLFYIKFVLFTSKIVK